jgi:hypothetical protein
MKPPIETHNETDHRNKKKKGKKKRKKKIKKKKTTKRTRFIGLRYFLYQAHGLSPPHLWTPTHDPM